MKLAAIVLTLALTFPALAAPAGAIAGDPPGSARAPATLTMKPAATKHGDTVEISFAVSGETDVAVDVLDSGGKVVRRLGAALLGAKSEPPPPFKPGLAQSITWDGRDPAGKPVSGGPFKARVRLGLKANFDRFIGWEKMLPLDLEMVMIQSIAVGPDRTLYVISDQGPVGNAGRSETRVWALSKEGEYLRTIYPPPATMDPRKLRGVDFLSEEPNRLKPRIYDRVCPSYMPQMRAINRQSMAATSDGRLVFINGTGTELYSFGPRCLLVMNTDGSIPRERLDGPTIAEGVVGGYTHLALSPDDKVAYFCGLDIARGKPHNVVYRVGLNLTDKPEVIFGQKGQAGAGKDGLNNPRGVATDKEGHVYVCDFSNDRIVVLEHDGKYLSELPVKGPELISVHPKTGAVYVVSMLGGKNYKLVKLGGLKDPKVAAELDLTSYGGISEPFRGQNLNPEMALDPYGDVPIIYLASGSSYARYRIMRVEDSGGALKATVIDTQSRGQIKGFPYPQGVDGEDNFFFLEQGSTDPQYALMRGWEAKAGTGELKPWSAIGKPSNGYRYEVGKDGYIYRGLWYTGTDEKSPKTYGMTRVDRDGKVVPFSATGEDSEHYLGKGCRFAFLRGNLCIRPDGNIWALWSPAFEFPINIRVTSLGQDGKVKNPELVSGLTGASSLRVDSRGNIYVAEGLNLDGKPYPPEIDEFVKKLRAKGTTARGPHSEAPEDCYGEGYGSILKFGPDGGKIVRGTAAGVGETLLASYPGKNKFVATGLKSIYPRISPTSPPRGSEFSACWCLSPLFDVDGYDRLFVPDAMQFKVRVLDANFNEITSFGDYDSATGKGGKDNLPGPPIPFEFPTHASVAGDVVYVTDTASCARRIVRVKLSYAAEASCALP